MLAEDLFLSGSIIQKKKVVGSRTLTFSFGLSLLLWIVFHTTLISSRASRLPLLLFLLPLDMSLGAAAPEAGFSSSLSREEKCFSGVFCSKFQTTIKKKKSCVVSRFKHTDGTLYYTRSSQLLLTCWSLPLLLTAAGRGQFKKRSLAGYLPMSTERVPSTQYTAPSPQYTVLYLQFVGSTI